MSYNRTGSIKLHCQATFPALVHLTCAPVILYCKTNQVHNCQSFLRLIYLSNIRADVHMPSVCLAIVTAFPQLVYLENGRGAQRITLIVHRHKSLLCLSSVDQSWERNIVLHKHW
jgi:hypothetical protein